jgi:hypothetical protein
MSPSWFGAKGKVYRRDRARRKMGTGARPRFDPSMPGNVHVDRVPVPIFRALSPSVKHSGRIPIGPITVTHHRRTAYQYNNGPERGRPCKFSASSGACDTSIAIIIQGGFHPRRHAEVEVDVVPKQIVALPHQHEWLFGSEDLYFRGNLLQNRDDWTIRLTSRGKSPYFSKLDSSFCHVGPHDAFA